MQRLIFLNRFFYPDHSATSQLLSDLAFHFAANGRDVHVITSQQRYDDPRALLPERETIRGVNIRRMPSTRFGRDRLAGRGLDYLSYFFAARAALRALARKGDTVIAKTDPPLLSIMAAGVTRRSGARLINWLQDLYPEVAIELGVPYLGGSVGHALRALRDRSLHAAAVNVAVGEKMAGRICAAGVGPNHVRVIPNWTDDDELTPVTPAANPLRAEWQLNDRFVIGYSGNLGRAHEFATILGAAEQLRGNPRVLFLFIGGGHSFNELARQVKERDLGGIFRFMPYQERVQLRFSLGVPDVHLISLRPEVEGLIVPSKFYGIAAAGRAMLAVVDAQGEFAPLIERYRCGLVIAPGDAAGLAQAIAALAADPASCAVMGTQARRMIEEGLSRRDAFDRWQQTLAQVEG